MVELRFSKRIRFGNGRSILPHVDLFTITNSGAIVKVVDALGPRLGHPTEILAPRIVREGFTAGF